MSFHNTAPCFLTFYNPYSLFKFKIFVLNSLLFMLHFVVGTIMYSYNMVEQALIIVLAPTIVQLL